MKRRGMLDIRNSWRHYAARASISIARIGQLFLFIIVSRRLSQLHVTSSAWLRVVIEYAPGNGVTHRILYGRIGARHVRSQLVAGKWRSKHALALVTEQSRVARGRRIICGMARARNDARRRGMQARWSSVAP